MPDDRPDPIPEPPPPHRSRVATVGKWAAIVIGAFVLLIIAAALFLNSDPGRSFITRQINEFETASGLDLEVGRIEGSIFGAMTLHDVRLRDPKGLFLSAPAIRLDWRPFALVRNTIDMRALAAGLVTLHRLPELRPVPSDPDAPLLPDIDIRLDRLAISRLIVEPPVTGRRHLLALNGSADIADGRARVAANVLARGGGDRLLVRLDAVPEEDRLQIAARMFAPADGLIAGLAGIERPLVARISGQGSWSLWRGQAQARLGGERLLDFAILARDGTFRIRGQAEPGLLLPGPVARLTRPALGIDLIAALDERRADTRLRLRSDALAVAAQGMVDLGKSRFGDFRIIARLLTPGSIAQNLSGRDVRLSLLLDGAFATPLVQYDLRAAALGFESMTVQALRASGRATVESDRILLPVNAAARAITGLGAAAGGTLTDIRIDGRLAISGDRIVSDDLRIRSNRIDATAIVVADLSAGRYIGALKGRVNRYRVDGIGVFNVSADADLEAGPIKGFTMRGRVRVSSVRIDNSSMRSLLGGGAVITANVALTPEGAITVDRLRLNAPQLTISQGEGLYGPDGRIRFRAQGDSPTYGPLQVAVVGTADNPDVRLRARRPNIGLPLTDVAARIRRRGAAYLVTATGRSPYGPLSAEISLGGGLLDVMRLSFGGIDLKGRLIQTAAGPYVGTLVLTGSGLDGTARLTAIEGRQAIEILARANRARLPLQPPVMIGQGVIRATAILYPAGPRIAGSANLADVRRGSLRLAKAQSRFDYNAGHGHVALVASGRTTAAFSIAAQARLSPDLIRVNMRGSANQVTFSLAQPAVLTRSARGWRLLPVTIALPRGRIGLAGLFGDQTELQATLRDVDLSLVESFAPGLGFGGRISGSLLYSASGNGFPTAQARLDIDDFSRSSIAAASYPVDIALAGSLSPASATLNSVIRRGDRVIGQVRAAADPITGGGSWTERLMAAPLAGGVRYNGPAELLWAMTGIADQELSGPIAIAADFGGRLRRPELTGVLRGNALRYENSSYGTLITNLAVEGRFTSSRIELISLKGRAGDGTISGDGTIGLAPAEGFPVNLSLTLARAQLARSEALGATVSGKLQILNGPATGPLIQGDLRLPEARYRVIRQGAAEIADLEGVRWSDDRERLARADADDEAEPPTDWKLDIRLRADNQIFVSGMGLESEWEADLRVGGTATHPSIIGRMEVIRGTYSFAGRRLELDSGVIRFNGSVPVDPAIAIVASTTVEGVTARINVTGRAQNPQIAFSSTPTLPQDEVVARLLFGNSITELSATQAIQLAAALNSLRGGGGGLNPLGKLRSASGIDRLRILGADEATGRGTALAAGLYISNDIYVEVITDARGFTATQLEIALSRSLSLLSQVSSFGGSSASIRYSKDY